MSNHKDKKDTGTAGINLLIDDEMRKLLAGEGVDESLPPINKGSKPLDVFTFLDPDVLRPEDLPETARAIRDRRSS